ncbi:MAG: helix-turn-helix domain-containing protein [Candidatus Hydrogenedentota bacterium]
MKVLEFIRMPASQMLLAGAGRSAGVPVALHYISSRDEGPLIQGWGGCGACRHVISLPGGRRACRLSRTAAGATALKGGIPVPFMCHMGFACVSIAALPKENFVLTFGPYNPAKAPHALTHSVRAGLEELLGEAPPEELPFAFDDVPVCKGDAVCAIAEWTAACLAHRWQELQAPAESPDAPAAEGGGDTEPSICYAAPTHPREFHSDPFQAGNMAAALAGGRLPAVREVLRALLEEAAAGKREGGQLRRARAVAVVAAALEAAQRARLDTAAAWGALPNLLVDLEKVQDISGQLDAAMRVLRNVGPPRPAPAGPPAHKPPAAAVRTTYKELNAILTERLADGVELREAAALLGEKPATISKRLKRKFGMSYSEYLARLRVTKAKEFFRRTRLSVTQVATRVGIADQSNFSKLFRKFEGMSPTEYRQRFGKKQ